MGPTGRLWRLRMRLLRTCTPAILLGATLGCLAQVSPAPSGAKVPDPVAPKDLYTDPAEACTHAGGQYLGELKCRMPGGATVPVLAGEDAFHAEQSRTVVPYGTPHSWALATTAITFQYDGDRQDLLAGTYATPDMIAKERRLLDQWWSIKSRDDLLNTLTWLQYTGHRKEFEELGRRIDTLDNQQFGYALQTPSLDEERRNQLQVARRNHMRLGDTGILAWDLVRYIALCRWGYLVGFLQEEEAWNLIMPAALTLQRSFGSWKELQDNFLVGRQFWSLQQTRQSGRRYQAILDQLLEDRSGPLQRNPWSMNLHVNAPLPTIAIGVEP